jgi:hypothetical protein
LPELLGQRLAQRRVIVDDQDLAKPAHAPLYSSCRQVAAPTVRIDDAAIFRVIRTIAAFYPHGHGTHAAN